MRKVLFWSFAALLIIGVAGIVYKVFRPTSVCAASSTAYTIVRAERVFDPNGALRVTNYYLEARRSDGSRVWGHTTPEVQDRRIYFANGDSVRINDLAARKSTYLQKQVGGMLVRDPAVDCMTPQDVSQGILPAHERAYGHPAVRFAQTWGRERLTMWYSLDFGCSILQQRFEHENGVSEQGLTSLTQGEPEASLFEVSSASQEVPPSRLFDCPTQTGSCIGDAMAAQMDKDYYDTWTGRAERRVYR
ncbi:MAG TPA: hypothetical protein VKB79_22805 [Bryobacteraceae bacterium]|nr:hypothetical protein [Bryobacteraceae bacterium]